ncbi:transketolase [Methylosinus sp. PW1]|uniref:transketolase n=1 Tax=Methylosinus sp. PW1 TaxID=107636 RepID=UPI000B2BF126|nr:transketolase [Methylosinus sp. PW1]
MARAGSARGRKHSPLSHDDVAAAARCAAARRRVISMSYSANSAHLGSSLGVVEILDAVLAVSDLRPATASAADRDRVILSKGHAAMAYYAALEQYGLVAPSLLDAYLQNGTPLWGHVGLTEAVPAIDATSGSLGHGLSLAAGFSLGHRLRGGDHRVFCILSDGECDEGSTWEAALFAGARKLSSLTAIVDYNHIQSLAPTKEVMDLEPFGAKWRSFGFETIELDGHDWAALVAALERPGRGRPRVILAHTVKGKGVARIENTVASHYKPALAADLELA